MAKRNAKFACVYGVHFEIMKAEVDGVHIQIVSICQLRFCPLPAARISMETYGAPCSKPASNWPAKAAPPRSYYARPRDV